MTYISITERRPAPPDPPKNNQSLVYKTGSTAYIQSPVYTMTTAVIVGGLLSCGLFLIFDCYYNIENAKPWTILAGSAAVPALLLMWGKRDNHRWATVKVSQESQLTERFATAVKLLGDKSMEIRLGGIYALERLSIDSERDHWAVMETLSAFIRENAPWTGNAQKIISFNLGQKTPAGAQKAQLPQKPRTDIQAALTVIGRREKVRRQYEKERSYAINLNESDLRAAALYGVHLERAFLRGAHLEGASLVGANLTGAFLSEAHLEGAFLHGTHLEGAKLWLAHLEGAKLLEANLEGTNLSDAHLEGANLTGAKLSEAYLEGAKYYSKRLYLTTFPEEFDPKAHGMVDVSDDEEESV